MPTQPTVNEGKHKELQERTASILLSENIVKEAMKLAGYSKTYANCHWKEWLRNVNLDEYRTRLRTKAAVFSDFMVSKSFEWALKDDPKWAQVAAKVHGDVTRAHLEDKTPTSVTFQLQTVKGQTINMGKNVDKRDLSTKKEGNENVIDAEVLDIKDKSGI